MKAQDIKIGDVLLDENERVVYTVKDVATGPGGLSKKSPPVVTALVQFRVDGGCDYRRWYPEDEVPIVRRTAE